MPWTLPYRGTVGMACLIVAESAIFIIFVVAYIFYIGKSLSGPTPAQVLELPIFGTICLLSSSITVHYAVSRAAQRKHERLHGFGLRAPFCWDRSSSLHDGPRVVSPHPR
jgi:cytochrome c oxidase subunit 3